MKILVVDDHSLIREALRGTLKDLEDDVAILEAGDSRQTLALAEQHSDLDLILLDLMLPDRDGFSLLAELRERYPAVSVVVLSAHDQRSHVVRALDLGALGYIPKNASREVMLRALQLVCSGGIYIPPQILRPEQPSPSTPAPPHRAAPFARGRGPDRVAGRRAGSHDAREEQQDDRPRARSGGADSQEPRERHPQGAQRHQPNGSRDRGRRAGLGPAEQRQVIGRSV